MVKRKNNKRKRKEAEKNEEEIKEYEEEKKEEKKEKIKENEEKIKTKNEARIISEGDQIKYLLYLLLVVLIMFKGIILI